MARVILSQVLAVLIISYLITFVEAQPDSAVLRSRSWLLIILLILTVHVVRRSMRGGGSRRGGRGGRGTGQGHEAGTGSNSNEGNENEEAQDEPTVELITFERADRSISRGDYPNKPKPGQPKLGVVHFCDKKSIKEARYKKTLLSILRSHWNGLTFNSKGEARSSFIQDVVNEFCEYYDYQEGFTKEEGDEAVKEHLAYTIKQNLYTERKKADKKVENAIARGEIDVNRRTYQPHYLTEDAWKAMNDYWDSPTFKRMSEIAKQNRAHKKLAHSSGAKPFALIREELEAAGGQPVTALELFEATYQKKGKAIGTLTNAAAVEVKEKLKKAIEDRQREQASSGEASGTNESLEENRKRDVELTLMAQGGPKRGRVLLHPRFSVTELLGPDAAATWVSQQTTMQTLELPGELIAKAMDDVLDWVQTLGAIDIVPRVFINEELRRLADAAVPNKNNPATQCLWDGYMHQASNMANTLLKRYKKTVDEGSSSTSAEEDLLF